MTSHVVDASIFGPLFFDDEKDELFAALPELIAEERCIVPQHWRLEVTNQVLAGLRRKRTTPDMARQAIEEIELFQVRVDGGTGQRIGEIYDIACRHGLTIYDAAYLELSIRRQLPLATYDKSLRKAAVAEGIEVIPA